MATQFIDIDLPINPYLANTVTSFLSSEIGQTIFGEFTITTTFSSDALFIPEQFITFDRAVTEFLANTVTSFLPDAIDSVEPNKYNVSTVVSNNNVMGLFTTAGTITSTIVNPTGIELVHIIDAQSIISTIAFGGAQSLDVSLESGSITQINTFGTANVFVSIGPQSTINEQTFGNFSDVRDIHRSLIFKDDNITKLGSNDDVEIASGVVIRASSQVLTGNTVPGSAAGFITIVINGVDYRMPFFNI